MTRDKTFFMRSFAGTEKLKGVKTAFDLRYLTEGPFTQEAEKQFTTFVGVDPGIAVFSCMTGVVLALNVMDIGKVMG